MSQTDLSYKPIRPPVAALPCDSAVPLATLAGGGDLGYGQSCLINPATGNAQLADDSTPHMIPGGAANMTETSTTSTVAGKAFALVSWGCSRGRPCSTTANDGFTAADIGKPVFCAGASTPGKLSHTGTTAAGTLKDRSIMGVCLGLDPDSPSGGPARPVVWEGPVAGVVARAALLASKALGGSLSKAVDAGATTDLAETLCDNVSPHHGRVVGVRFIVSGTTLPASGATDFKTLILWKRPAAGGTAVAVASADTKTTAWTQWETVSFTLSADAAATDKLEDVIYTVTETHGGTGAAIPAGKLVIDLEVS